jgi:hypothetical protein
MSKSELRYLGPTFNITRKIKRELKENLDKLKIALKDDLNFANFLVEQVLLIGKSIYFDEIESLLFKKYPVIDKVGDPEGEQNFLIRNELLTITYNLAQLIFGDWSTKKQMYSLPDNEQEQFHNVLHYEIEAEVRNIFFIKNQNIDIMGENENFDA